MFKRIVVGISGGVDSAVATLALKRRGFDVIALFMQNWDVKDEKNICKADEDFKDAQEVCDVLGVKIHHVNFVKEYWNEVFSYFLNEYENGYTPNPDILCNRFIKFDYFFYYARENLHADAIATGHYARTSFKSFLENYTTTNKVKLLRPFDCAKDQTFFLSQVKQKALQRTMFPLGDILKSEVKKIAFENKLIKVSKKKESMGICFIGNRNFQNFISEYLEDKPGKFVDLDNSQIVGEHKGHHQWTIGQRTRIEGRPLPYFVARKDIQTNTLYVVEGTKHPALYTEIFFTEEPHWIYEKPQELQKQIVLTCQFTDQSVKKPVDCEIFQTEKGLIVSLPKPKRAIAPGQFAVFYKNDECLGSARIVSSGPSNYFLYWLQRNKIAFVAHKINRYKAENNEICTSSDDDKKICFAQKMF